MQPPAEFHILEVALDETELPVNCEMPNATSHAMVVHARSYRALQGQVVERADWALPPAVVESTKASTLFGALEARLPITLEEFLQTARFTVLILNADSARSCLKLGRMSGPIVPTL
eukprot:6329388-Pyramimonas_sp.AAC.1